MFTYNLVSMIALVDNDNIRITDKMIIRVVKHQMAGERSAEIDPNVVLWCRHPEAAHRLYRLGRGTQWRYFVGILWTYNITQLNHRGI